MGKKIKEIWEMISNEWSTVMWIKSRVQEIKCKVIKWKMNMWNEKMWEHLKL